MCSKRVDLVKVVRENNMEKLATVFDEANWMLVAHSSNGGISPQRFGPLTTQRMEETQDSLKRSDLHA
jgi:hypothetical protein|tara:strand:+ start:92 stop:295 length:204 start_codon:yes stop_codon:yes gene_type:complete